jgi:hypothetical protein
MAQRTLTIVFKVNGIAADAAPGGTIKFGGASRTPLVVNGVAGRDYTETPEPGGATFKVVHGADTDIETIRNWKDVTLVATTDSGKVYQMAGAYTTNAVELADGDGTINVEMGGPPWEEI